MTTDREKFDEAYAFLNYSPETLDLLWQHRQLLSQGVPSTDPRSVELQRQISEVLGPFPKVNPSEKHLLEAFLKKRP
jgi:hypothetical protein